jgi:hypothetical protein
MKKLLVSVIIILCFAGTAFPADQNWSASPATAVTGRMGATKAYTFSDNAAVTLATMYVTGWDDATTGGGHYPVGALISVETNDARISCGGGTPTTSGLGHLLAAGNSFMFVMASGESCKMIPKTAGSYPLVQLTPIYSK